MSTERILKRLNGFSGSDVYLVQDQERTFVRKINNIDRNFQRLSILRECGFNVPNIYKKQDNVLEIQYIPSLDIKTYLKFYSIERLADFILQTLDKLSENKINKDYSGVYSDKLSGVDFSRFIFTKTQLIDVLPKILPSSNYFGDLTLENILYGNDDLFYLIDCSSIEYDSYVFDIAKLRQDLTCKWFLRNDSLNLDVKLLEIERKILKKYPEADNCYLLILMLLRVYKHAKENSFEQKFLVSEINKLWKS